MIESLNNFENLVFNNLKIFGLDFASKKSVKLGLAVSGGADSISLLHSISEISKLFNLPLKVITVNHKIRPDEQSKGDVLFVEEECLKLKKQGYDIELFIKELLPGQIFELAKQKKCGIEDAARTLRYLSFEEFKEKFNLDYILIAHNKNDNLETILMRFFQGNFSSGIKTRRDYFIRPLLNITREQIEDYLFQKNIKYRTDSTNFDENYFRNKIRHSIIPVLDKKIPEWGNNVISASQKTHRDEVYFENQVELLWQKAILLSKNKDENLDKNPTFIFSSVILKDSFSAILERLLYKAISNLNITNRFPYRHIKSFSDSILNGANEFSVCCDGIELKLENQNVSIKKYKNKATNSFFFGIIEDNIEYSFPFGTISVSSCGEKNEVLVKIKNLQNENFSYRIKNLKLPFAVKSWTKGDTIKNAEEKNVNISDIFTSWHVNPEIKSKIPVFFELQKMENIAVLGEIFNYKNWIVK